MEGVSALNKTNRKSRPLIGGFVYFNLSINTKFMRQLTGVRLKTVSKLKCICGACM